MTLDRGRLLIRRFQESWDDSLLISLDGRRFTYGQVWTGAARLAAEWSARGLTAGDAVALICRNDLAFPCRYLACFIGGFVAVPINPDLHRDDIAFILELTRPGLALETPPKIDLTTTGRPPEDMATHESELAAIFFTSGTTGRPKGVRHSLSNLIDNVAAFNDAMGLTRRMRMYHVMPAYYMAGFLNALLSPIVAGGTVIVAPSFSAQSSLDFWRLAVEHEANCLWLTPTMAAALCRMARNHRADSELAKGFTTIFCGTAPLSANVRREFLTLFGVPLQESYGTSELLLVSAQSRDDALVLADSVGRPLPNLRVALRRDDEGRNELFIASPYAMLGYLTEDGISSPALSDSSFPTGDIAELEHGVLHITGRIKDLIIRGGINVSPRAVENAVQGLPGVKDVAVIGRPHDFWGEALVMCLEADGDVDDAALERLARERCHERLARAQRPDEIRVYKAFPRTAIGKIQKHLLREGLTR